VPRAPWVPRADAEMSAEPVLLEQTSDASPV
jgi:hypothetical protein